MDSRIDLETTVLSHFGSLIPGQRTTQFFGQAAAALPLGWEAMTEIVRLWRENQLPIKDGVYFADGRSYAADVERGCLSVVEQFDLAEMLAKDADWLTRIDSAGAWRIRMRRRGGMARRASSPGWTLMSNKLSGV